MGPSAETEAGQGGDEVDAVVRLQRAGEGLGLARLGDDPERVAEPLHGGAGGRRPRRVVDLAAQAPGDRRQQALAGVRRLGARVEQDEAAGPVGVLGLPGALAGLAEQGRLLIAGDSRDRNVAAEDRVVP